MDAGELLASVFGNADTAAYDVGGHFSCSEANTIAEVLRMLGQPLAADWWLYMHGQNDETTGCDCPDMGGCEVCGDEGAYLDQHSKLHPPDGINPFSGLPE